MKQIEISGTVRTAVGKKATRDLRRQGEVPCVIYGEKRNEKGEPEAFHFSLHENEAKRLIYTPNIYLVILHIDGKDIKAVLRETQFHPVTDRILHIDFYEVTEEKPIVMGVPVVATGLAEGVRAGGKLMMMVRKLNVRAPYTAIPEKLEVDVTTLGLGKSIKCGTLAYDGLEIVTPKEVIVCTVKMTRAAMGAAAAAAKA